MSTLPGTRLRAVAQRVCRQNTMAHVVDPIVADMQVEWGHARAAGRRWRARWVYFRAVVNLCVALSLHVVLPGARGIGADDRRPAFSTPGLGRLVTVAVVTLVGAAVAVEAVAASSRAAFEFELMKFLLFMVGGGLVIAILLVFGSRARRRSTDDPFAGTAFSTDTINFAHVRVAGVGGAGLVLASVGVALQYSLTTVVLASGLVGGLALALILIRLRQRRA